MQRLLSCVFLLLGALSLLYQPASGTPLQENKLLFLWWNVENLFDTHNDPATEDDEFTPGGKLQWTEKKLALKQMRIRYLLSAIEAHPEYRKYPDILAFAEVENRPLFQETLSKVQGINYRLIYHESSDPRGIDIGLAYNPNFIKAEASKAYSMSLDGKPTRKIIVAGFSTSSHPFHLILNHWPSRSFDTKWSEQKRIAAAKVTRHIVDSLLVANPKADIILMGDFNDEPGDRSLKEVLGSSPDDGKVRMPGSKLLYNCWSGYKGIGSYSFGSHWQKIDQILLSSGMLDQKRLYVQKNAFRCISFNRLLDADGKKPYSTFAKRKYQGGYSDHLPLLLKVSIEK
ncbi:MAG: endonuclease/exonuclease/phosphatase family protein [Chlorobium sp.]|nr:MAG: endonuclease/exonuclease/phosphatase family protein [Chlorobium sp.]